MEEYTDKLITIRPCCINDSFLKKAGFTISRISVDKINPFWIRVMFSYNFANKERQWKTKTTDVGSRSFTTKQTGMTLDFPTVKYRYSSGKRRHTTTFGINVLVNKLNGILYEPKFVENYKWRVACYFANKDFSKRIKELLKEEET